MPSLIQLCKEKFHIVIMLIGALCLTMISSDLIILNFTLICILPESSATVAMNTTLKNTSSIPTTNTIDYSPNQRDWLMWSSAIGATLAFLPFSVFLYRRYSAKNLFMAAGVLAAFCSAIFPPVALYMPFYSHIIVRFLQGVTFAATFDMIGLLCRYWSTASTETFFISVLTSYSPISVVITGGLSGLVCQFGWPLVYYGHAFITIVLFIFWLNFYTDSPDQSPFYKQGQRKESQQISTDDKSSCSDNNKTDFTNEDANDASFSEKEKKSPYMLLIRNRTVWLIWMNAFVFQLASNFLVIYQSEYLHFILGFSISMTNYIGSIALLAHIVVRIISGFVIDKINCISDYKKVILFNTTGSAMPGICIMLFGLCTNPPLAVFILILNMNLSATIGGGFYKCAALCSKEQSHLIIAVTQFTRCVSLLIVPLFRATMIPDEMAHDQWSWVFALIGIQMIVANILLCIDVSYCHTKEEKKMQNKS